MFSYQLFPLKDVSCDRNTEVLLHQLAHVYSLMLFHMCSMCATAEKGRIDPISHSRSAATLEKRKRKGKKTPNKHAPPKFPLDKQAEGDKPLEETRKLGFFHVLCSCNSSWKLKNFIFFRYNLRT